MGDNSTIEWTDATWNPITGCSLVSEGCRHCYAATLAATRLKNHPSREGLARLNADGEAKFTGEVRFNAQWIDQPLRWRKPRRIFVCAHGDLFHEAVPDEWIDRVFAVMALTPHHTFQVLSKRPGRMRDYLSAVFDTFHASPEGMDDRFGQHCATVAADPCAAGWFEDHVNWPLPNVWLGVSAEDQATLDARVPLLLDTPAVVRFVSYEPALGPIDLKPRQRPDECIRCGEGPDAPHDHPDGYRTRGLDWVIAGGESGPGARPAHPDWFRRVRDDCATAGVAFFFKQWGEWGPGSVNMTTGQAVFRAFPDYQTWVNKASTWVNGGIGLDALGRQCRIGADMMRARDEDTFPVTVMHRIGKARAGRLLDGRAHDELPAHTATTKEG